MASKYPKMGKQGTAGKRKHTSLVTAQKPEIIRQRESGKSHRQVMASYSIALTMI